VITVNGADEVMVPPFFGSILSPAANDINDGMAVSDAGDVNGDGIADFIVGGALESTLFNEGESYVVFGTASGLPSTVDLSALAAGDGSTGFAIPGSVIVGQSGGLGFGCGRCGQ
jgi:hypothetical protein